MTVTYETVETFNEAIEAFVIKGLQFKANGDTFTITFTG